MGFLHELVIRNQVSMEEYITGRTLDVDVTGIED
jgi:hypothetical protein